MTNKNLLLDADPSLIEKNLRFVKNELEDDFNNFFGTSNPDNQKPVTTAPTTTVPKSLDYKIVKPVPGKCIKAYKAYDDSKIFLNICQTPEIPAPPFISEEKLQQLIMNETPSSYKVPMSISELRQIKDRSNNMATACDIAINPMFYDRIQQVSLFHNFFLTIVFEAIEDKFGVEISLENWKILKNHQFMGGLISHRIQNRDVENVYNAYKNEMAGNLTQGEENNKILEEMEKFEKNKSNKGGGGDIGGGDNGGQKKLIVEIGESKRLPSSSSTKKEDLEQKVKAKNKIVQIPIPTKPTEISHVTTKKPEYSLIKQILPNKDIQLIAEFHLPECVSSREIVLDVGEDRILLEARKRGYLFDGFIAYHIQQDKITAEFNSSSGILTAILPVTAEQS